MSVKRTQVLVLSFAIMLLAPVSVWAHQPWLIGSARSVTVTAAEVSKAYYGNLDGAPAEYHISAVSPFELYANVLVPLRSESSGRPSMEILRDGRRLTWFDGATATWTKFHEPFAGDDYLKGPEYRSTAEAGSYVIRVFNADNSGKYVLAIGEKEDFPPAETLRSLLVIPQLKSGFFGVPKWTFLFSIFGSLEFLVMLAIGFLLAILYRRLLKVLPRSRPSTRRNIGRDDRLWRMALALVALAYGLYAWSAVAFLLTGFLIYEAVAGWCAFYAAIGRNTCPA